jgi:hypothetical protein
MTSTTPRLIAATLLFCCLVPTGSARTADKPAPDADREIVFRVGSLGCTLVEGVGCGHLLAPLLADLDRCEGVSHASTNWTGTQVRVTVAPTADRERVAVTVRAVLADKGYEPVRLGADELARSLSSEDWRGVGQVHELSNYEFHTTARRRLEAFASAEQLGKSKTDALLRLADDLWQKSADEKVTPPTDEEGYRSYWNRRVTAFKGSLLRGVKEKKVLTADQLSRLAAEAHRQRGGPSN